MGLRVFKKDSKGQQERLATANASQGAPRSMDNGQTKTTPEKEPIEEVFRQCESPLLAYAMKMVQDGEQAQEIVQEAFVRLHANARLSPPLAGTGGRVGGVPRTAGLAELDNGTRPQGLV